MRWPSLQTLRRFQNSCFIRLRGAAPAWGLGRVAFRLLVFAVPLFLLARLPGNLGRFADSMAWCLTLLLCCFVGVLLYRLVTRRLLWKVRNRLVLTCLLMGLAPVVLFGTLAGMAAYVFSGQFAISSVFGEVNSRVEHMHDRSMAQSIMLQHRLEHPAPKTLEPHSEWARPQSEPRNGTLFNVWQDGVLLPAKLAEPPSAPSASEKPAPSTARPGDPFSVQQAPLWLHAGASGVFLAGGRLYLGAAHEEQVGTHTLLVFAAAPLDRDSLASVADGIGSVSILPTPLDTPVNPDEALPPPGRLQHSPAERSDFTGLQGGALPAAAHTLDPRVFFSAPLHMVDWNTGTRTLALIGVVSRPSLLYKRLFSSSVTVGAFLRWALVAIAILFSLVELLALWMAIRLSHTITGSIADLYRATVEVEHGNLGHRIPVRRRDQLAALATSFNAMAGSVSALLVQGRENENMQRELAIAQEVQNNLFPLDPVGVPGFELHGVCKPARTVGGDYYDFIPSGSEHLYLALGDISGKGISAALLMASLHSAVRAYRFGESVENRQHPVGAPGMPTHPSPAGLLALLNRHLYTSTQPERYATLFLACYNSATRQLVYSTAGHLPPLVLCADGKVKRLDCGGSVVGLLDGMAYSEAMVQLEPGDLLIAYSDGITEPENEWGEWGEQRLLELVRRYRDQPVSVIAAHAMRAVEEWMGGGEQPDDMTLVLARQL